MMSFPKNPMIVRFTLSRLYILISFSTLRTARLPDKDRNAVTRLHNILAVWDDDIIVAVDGGNDHALWERDVLDLLTADLAMILVDDEVDHLGAAGIDQRQRFQLAPYE